jgi:hypothetical protein
MQEQCCDCEYSHVVYYNYGFQALKFHRALRHFAWPRGVRQRTGLFAV